MKTCKSISAFLQFAQPLMHQFAQTSPEKAITAIETFSTTSRYSAEELTKITAETFGNVVKERFDDDVKNISIVVI